MSDEAIGFGFHEFCDLYLMPAPELLVPDRAADIYDCAEAYIAGFMPEDVAQSLAELEALAALPTEQARRRAYGYDPEEIPQEEGAWDEFMAAFRARVLREMDGDRSQPMVNPRGRVEVLPGTPLSPQGYDVSLPSAGSFDNEPVATAVVEAALEAYGDRMRTSFEDSVPGVTRRLQPMRVRFDQTVGVVALRDGGDLRTRLAVVLVHDVGGKAHVFNAFPMEEVPEPPQFKSLSVLCGGWLHADWVDDYPRGRWDPVEQVRRFATTEPPEVVEQAAVELAAVRATGTEDDRRRAIRGLCSYFLPRPAGQLDRFLSEVAEVLDNAVGGRR